MTELAGPQNRLESKETIADRTSYAIVMVKPHAMREVSDRLLLEIFDGGIKKHKPYLEMRPEQEEVLGDTRVFAHFYRDLSDPRYHQVLETFYGNDKGKRQYPIIEREYTGECMFMVVSSSYPVDEFYRQLQIFKGKENLLTENGEVLQKGRGVRGLFITPRESFDMDNLTDDNIVTITRNVIHVADEVGEAARAIRQLLTANEVKKLAESSSGFRDFLNKNAPVSIV